MGLIPSLGKLYEKFNCVSFETLFLIFFALPIRFSQLLLFNDNAAIKYHLHWQCWLAKLAATATLDCTSLGHLG
jgi:hypothetical protein